MKVQTLRAAIKDGVTTAGELNNWLKSTKRKG